MPDFTGFDFIQSLKNPPKVILVTSDVKFAIEAFEYECNRLFGKAITEDRFKSNSKANLQNSAQDIGSKTNGRTMQMNVNIDRRLIKLKWHL
jgi:DNA-binding LytR/AlgR family response regulator